MLQSMTPWKIYPEGDLYYVALCEALRQAENHIRFESYIFTFEPLARQILHELAAAAKRGVKVQLLVDGAGSLNWLDDLERFCHDSGIEFRIYRPFPRTWQKWAQQLWSRTQWIKKINRRNHRKLIIIDQKIAFLGSLNIAACHSRKYMGNLSWRDVGARISGPEIHTLCESFDHSWQTHTKIQKLLDPKTTPFTYAPLRGFIRLNSTRRWRRLLYRDLLERIRRAEERISITSAYFLPKRSLVRALVKARQRGVKVDILVPGPTDVPIVKWASYSLLNKLLSHSIHIWEYQGRNLHSKYMLIDQYASMGSMNLNHRSLIHDLELEVQLPAPELIRALDEIWHEDLAHARALETDFFARLNPLRRWLYRLAFQFRYWL